MSLAQTMSLAEVKEMAAKLPTVERKELIGYLLEQGRSERQLQEYREEMARKIDDKDPAHWVSLEDLQKRLSE